MLNIGIQPLELAQKYSLNWKNVVPIIILTRYIFTGPPIAETFKDYAEISYGILSVLLVMFNLVVFILKSREFFELINNFKTVIQQRKSCQFLSILSIVICDFDEKGAC